MPDNCQIVTEFFGMVLDCRNPCTTVETVGCVHEHVRVLRVCTEHTVEAAEKSGPTICRPCVESDGHECIVRCLTCEAL